MIPSLLEPAAKAAAPAPVPAYERPLEPSTGASALAESFSSAELNDGVEIMRDIEK